MPDDTAMGYENVLVDRDGPVGVVTLNRPKVLNALSPALIGELSDALGGFDAAPEIGAARACSRPARTSATWPTARPSTSSCATRPAAGRRSPRSRSRSSPPSTGT